MEEITEVDFNDDFKIVARINPQMTRKELQKIIKDVTTNGGGAIFCEPGVYVFNPFRKPTLFQRMKLFLIKHGYHRHK